MRKTPILVVGGTGKTGRRVAEKLAEKGHPVRATSRSGPFHFDWAEPARVGSQVAGCPALAASLTMCRPLM